VATKGSAITQDPEIGKRILQVTLGERYLDASKARGATTAAAHR